MRSQVLYRAAQGGLQKLECADLAGSYANPREHLLQKGVQQLAFKLPLSKPMLIMLQ